MPAVFATNRRRGGGLSTIFGYSFEDIQRAQQGGRLSRPVDTTKPATTDHSFVKGQELLDAHGLDGLKAMGYFGVIDRLQRAGLIQPPAQ